MTHSDLVAIAANWLAKTRKCQLVLTEFACINDVCLIPDAIGWASGWCILVECKTSRADFLVDRKKLMHALPDCAPGQERWYMAPQGLLTVEPMPDGWMLVEVARDGKLVIPPYPKRANRYGAGVTDRLRRGAETPWLLSVIRRQREEIAELRRLTPPATVADSSLTPIGGTFCH